MMGKTERLQIVRERLTLYREREKQMLSPEGVKAYGIAGRSLQRYDTALKDVQDMIKALEQEERELEAQAVGGKPRKAVAVVIRDL